MISDVVSPGDVTIASQYNNLRIDALLMSASSPVYDSNGNMTSCTVNGVVLTFTYDGNGDILTWNDTSDTLTVARNKDGLLTSIS